MNRLDGLTQYLLAFPRGGDPTPEAISLNDFVTKILPLISYSAPAGIRFTTHLSANLPPVRVDTTHLQVVLTAIVANAEESIEGRGRIHISTRRTDPKPVFFEGNADLEPGNQKALTFFFPPKYRMNCALSYTDGSTLLPWLILPLKLDNRP